MSKETTPSSKSKYLSTSFLGEVVLLAFVGWFFVYMLWVSQEWGRGAWLMPRIVVISGIPFWIWRVVTLFKAQISSEGGQIMDMGFLEADATPAQLRMRWVQLLGTTGALLVGLMIFGYHIGVPLYVATYLMVLGKVKWWFAAGTVLFFETVIVGVYDNILLSEWNRPLIQPFYDLFCSSCDVWIWAF
jgi:hypothetical protein